MRTRRYRTRLVVGLLMVTAPAFAVVAEAGAELAGFVTTGRPWVGEARGHGRAGGGLRIRQGRRRVSAALLDVGTVPPLDPPTTRDALAGAPLDPLGARR